MTKWKHVFSRFLHSNLLIIKNWNLLFTKLELKSEIQSIMKCEKNEGVCVLERCAMREIFWKIAAHWLKLCTVEIINLLCRNFPGSPLTRTQILADISGSQQLSLFLSLAFPWLDIYPALDWLKERKFSSLLCTLYLSLVLLVSFNYELCP